MLTAIPIGSKKVGTAMPTFSITVELNDPSIPMTEQEIMDYILVRLESQKIVYITNLVRDY